MIRLGKKREDHVNPLMVVWPAYCLGIVPCWHDREHRAHFWVHPSGYVAVCAWKSKTPQRWMKGGLD